MQFSAQQDVRLKSYRARSSFCWWSLSMGSWRNRHQNRCEVYFFLEGETHASQIWPTLRKSYTISPPSSHPTLQSPLDNFAPTSHVLLAFVHTLSSAPALSLLGSLHLCSLFHPLHPNILLWQDTFFGGGHHLCLLIFFLLFIHAVGHLFSFCSFFFSFHPCCNTDLTVRGWSVDPPSVF